MNPVRVGRVTFLLLDDPGIAVPRQGELALVPRHPDPHHGVHLIEQPRKDDLAAARRRARLTIDGEYRADHDRGHGGEDQY